MPFIGKQPEVGAYSKLDAITASATATYNLTLGGGAYYPSSANHLLVSLNGVMQAPQDSFTVSGSTIVFDSALTSSDNIDFIMALGDVLDIGTPSDGTVTSSKLAGALTTPSNLTVGGVLDATTAIFDRASTDGVIVNLQKNNGSIGSIDVDNGDNLTVQGKSDHSGLQFGTNAIFPHKNSANIDATIDLGESTLRWKDIYLSGGVNFSANSNPAGMTSEILDDYEEGTWTPRLQDLNGNEASAYTSGYPVGTYTKVGRHVWVNFSIRITNKGSMTGNYVHVAGLPFNRDGTGEGRGTGTIDYFSGLASSRSYLALDCTSTTSVMWLVGGSNSTSTSYVSVGNLNNTCMFKGGAHYITAS
jgi:hypothetical protein